MVVERDRLYERVWGYAMAHGDRSVDVFIRKLRRKLQRRSQAWSYIHTHFGIGYRFEPVAEGEPEPVTSRIRPRRSHRFTRRSPAVTSFAADGEARRRWSSGSSKFGLTTASPWRTAAR